MFTRVSRYLSAAVCAFGMMLATGVQADDWRHDRGSHRGHHDGWRRGHDHDRRDYDRRDYRGYRNDWRDAGYYRGYSGRYSGRDWDRRGWYRPYYRVRCDDRRHYRHSHFHVPVRYYSSEVYAAYPYRGVYRDRGAEATVILSFPL